MIDPMQELILDMPKEPAAQLNYMSVLATCENYHLPTCPSVTVQELISGKLYHWYTRLTSVQEEQHNSRHMNDE